MTKPIRLLCVDDHAFLAEGIKTRLSLEEDMEFVGWIESVGELSREIRRTDANIVLLDIEMPGTDSFEVLRNIKREHAGTRVIMFSAFVRDHYIDAAVKGGAWGYVSKSDTPTSVVEAIRKVSRGEFGFGPKVLQRCRTGGRNGMEPSSRLGQLSPRELGILRLIAKGMSRTDIAETIHRSPKTVDNHRAAIMAKLKIHDRVELARFALREGLAEAG
ncbi:MAG: response regulator transcription factor [Planctomycetes bacterium]|nr:response regulator transcription factor [Planctomycetota bacterium]